MVQDSEDLLNTWENLIANDLEKRFQKPCQQAGSVRQVVCAVPAHFSGFKTSTKPEELRMIYEATAPESMDYGAQSR